MTVQDLIDELMKVEDKSKEVVVFMYEGCTHIYEIKECSNKIIINHGTQDRRNIRVQR